MRAAWQVAALKRYGQSAVDHVWLAAKVMVFCGTDVSKGTASDQLGTVFRVVEDSLLKQTIVRDKCEPKTLAALARGFVAGMLDGSLLVYQRPGPDVEGDDSGELSLTTIIRGPEDQGPVRSILVSDRDRTALIMCKEICVARMRELINRAKDGDTRVAADAAPGNADDHARK